jgi:hypothetical protein
LAMAARSRFSLFVVVFALFVLGWAAAVPTGLYGLTPVHPKLVKINPITAKQEPVGNTSLPTELSSQQLSSIDVQRGIFYAVLFNTTSNIVHLAGISIATGKLISNVRLPFAPTVLVGVGQTCNVIPQTGEVLVTGRDRIGGKHHILKVDPKTGKNKLLNTIGDVDVLAGASAYDVRHNMLWLQFGDATGIRNFGFDVATGRLVYQIPDALNLESMVYDPVTQKIYGIGLKVVNSTNFYRVLLSLDSSNANTTVIGPIPGYFVIDASELAIDPNGRRLFCFLQPTGSSRAPFHLLSISLRDGSILSSPTACVGQLCPWSLAYQY